MPKTQPIRLVALPTQMISAYFAQTEQYFSETKGAFLQVSDMHPTYAANAAARYLETARSWAVDAGSDATRPSAWMIRRPLFLALVQRAHTID